MAARSRRSEKLDLRLTPNAKTALRAAASVSNRSVSEFVLESAIARADETLADQRPFGLNAAQWKAFLVALETPPRPLPLNDARMPSWISDKEGQRAWNSRFIEILKRDYVNSDASISAILRDGQLSELCATRIRHYVDKDVTLCLNAQSKSRGIEYRKQLEAAIVGLHATIGLIRNRVSQGLVAQLGRLAEDFSQALPRCKQAFATKRHGRDRDHAILDECHSFLMSKLGLPLTYVTLANLVNAGFEADGRPPKEPVTEEQIRKNLSQFGRNNPFWGNEIDPRFVQFVSDPETK